MVSLAFPVVCVLIVEGRKILKRAQWGRPGTEARQCSKESCMGLSTFTVSTDIQSKYCGEDLLVFI